MNAFVTQVWRDVVRAENPEPEDSGFGRIWPEKVLAKCVVRMPFWSRKFDESGSEIIVASAYVGEVGKAASLLKKDQRNDGLFKKGGSRGRKGSPPMIGSEGKEGLGVFFFENESTNSPIQRSE